MNLPANRTNSTLPGSASASPESLRWIDRLFQKFEDMYGSKWAAQWGGIPLDRVKRTWAEDLGTFATNGDVMVQAISAQKSNPFPPTLPEFLNLCREAAKRIGDKTTPALPHKLTPEEIEHNRKRAAELIAGLSRSKQMANAATHGTSDD